MAPRGNAIGATNRTRTTPIPVQRTQRVKTDRVLTSLNAGYMTPLLVTPLLREDSVTSANYRVAFEMSETVEVLMNAINVRVMAYLVPKLALDRFGGLDDINRSYEGIATDGHGGTIPPWFNNYTIPAGGVPAVLKKMGKHARVGQVINDDYIQAYNAIWNFRATNRSQDLALRTATDVTLAPAFWTHQTFAHIVPDFDQAIIDGEVALNVVGGVTPTAKAHVTGIGFKNIKTPVTGTAVRESGKTTTTTYPYAGGVAADEIHMRMPSAAGTAYPEITADVTAVFNEMISQGVTVSLSNIEVARKTQAFANLRRMYAGHSDEYIIDLLMDGIEIPDESWKQPILLADETTTFGMSKRYASDGANLTESVVNGLTFVDLRFSVPKVNPGGVIMILAEISPEQLFERQEDPYMHATGVGELPQFLRDTLDPEKVVVVQNEEIDLDHDTPTATFGYAPLNWEWAKSIPQIGGKFYRPAVNAAFDEDRQRIWAVETENPTLSKDFYLVSGMHYKPFVVTDAGIDHFECLVRGDCVIRGNTVFGGLLVEAEDQYAEVMEEVPMDRIEKP